MDMGIIGGIQAGGPVLDARGAAAAAAGLARGQVSAVGQRKAQKVVKEKLFDWMVRSGRPQLDVGVGIVEVRQVASAMPCLDLLAIVLAEPPYNWQRVHIDALMTQLAETKQRVAATKPALRIRINRQKGRPKAPNAPNRTHPDPHPALANRDDPLPIAQASVAAPAQMHDQIEDQGMMDEDGEPDEDPGAPEDIQDDQDDPNADESQPGA
jgi:hypothetical protein